MKQAIQEGFILDVLKHYTPVESYYRLMKTVEDDPEFDTKKAQKKLRRYVESHDHAIRKKAEIMVDHFHDQVIASARSAARRGRWWSPAASAGDPVLPRGSAYLKERKSPYKAIVAFSGEHEYGGQKVTEATLNGFPSSQIERRSSRIPTGS
jgi:type I restriction enzyme, R subunit